MADNSSFGSWLKNALVKPIDETTVTTETATSTQPAFKVTPTFKIQTPVAVVDGELDETYINHLSDFMEKNNQPGPDYLEFAHSLDEMNSEMGDGVSEEKIFQMTYKVGYKQSLPIPKLLETASLYITLFDQHKKDFDGYLDTENQKTIGSKIDESNKLAIVNSDSLKKIEELKKQITILESNVEANNLKLKENSSIIETETQKLQTKKVKFEKSYAFVVGKINGDIEKIKTYLKDIK